MFGLRLNWSQYKKMMELNPQLFGIRVFLAMVYLLQSHQEEALAMIQTEPNPNWRFFGQALFFHATGKEKESAAALADFIKNWHKVAAYQIAEIYGYRQDTDHALEWLNTAFKQRDTGLTTMKGDPFLAPIKNDPRYIAFLKKMRLPID